MYVDDFTATKLLQVAQYMYLRIREYDSLRKRMDATAQWR